MSEIILTVDTPVLKGEKGDKGETGVFDYGELERIVELNLGDKLEKINKGLDGKVNTDESHSMVNNDVISTFKDLEKWVDNPFITKDENGEPLEEARIIVKMFDTKVDNTDLDAKVEEATGALQNYIDEKLVTAGSGDMLKSVYDKNGDGIVDLAKQADNASTVNGKTVETSVPENALFSDTTYDEAYPDKAGLMSSGDKVKLNGIASGATRVEVVDDVNTTDISKALSANQGKVLNDSISSVNSSLGENFNNLTSKISSLEKGQKILWSGGIHMTETQTAQLSEKVSEQKNGIAIIMCLYAGGQVKGTDLYYSFVPKIMVSANDAYSISCSMHCCTAGFGSIGTKYLHVHNSFIEGHSSNTSTGTVSDIAFKNNAWVLYKVIGV